MRRWLTVLAVTMLSAGLLAAQGAPEGGSAPANSSALVARLSAISGTVSTSRGDTGEWDTGALNTPLLTGDKVAAGEGGRAEVQLDYADVARLGSNSQLNLATLNQNQIQVQVASGLVDYVVLKHAQYMPEIDTPNIAIHPREPGVYRIDVLSDSETQVIVRKGSADISTPQGSTPLRSGQLMTVEGTDSPQYQIGSAPPEDDFDHWNKSRDRRVEEAQSRGYTNPYYTGVQDLDGYGYWTVVPGYGRVWVPNHQAGDWAPYSDGRWVWEPGWGWTWVDYAPWGWAPYHYGRWFLYGANWAWWPGPVTPYYRPIWAPAYVSFFGWGGGGFRIGVSIGNIGWLPVGPSDPFRPWWGYGGGSRVRITNVTVINNYYGNRRVVAPLAMAEHGRVRYSNLDAMMTNARVREAIVRVPSSEFGRGVMRGRSHVSVSELRRGSVLGGTLPVTPTRACLSVTHRAAANAVPRRAATHFFGSRGAVRGAAARPGFTQEQHRVENAVHGGARVGAATNRGGFAAHGMTAQRGHAVERNAAPATRPGWQSFGARRGAPSGPAISPNAGRNAGAASQGNRGFRGPARGSAPQGSGGRVSPGTPFGSQRNEPHRGASMSASPETQASSTPAARSGWHRFNRQPAGASAGAEGGRSTQPNFVRAEPRAESRPMPSEPRSSFQRPERPAYRAMPEASPERQPRMREQPARPPLQVGHPIVQSRGNFGGAAPRVAAPAPTQEFHGVGRGRR